MIVFNSYEEIESYILKNGRDAIMDVANQVLIMVKAFVEENLYGKYAPKNYDRTYNFLNCFKVKELPRSRAREYGFQIYIDYDEIQPHKGTGGKWNQHQNVWDEDVSRLIPIWMDEGHAGLTHQKGIHYIKYIMTLFQSNSLVKAKLRKRFEYVGSSSEGANSFSGESTNIGMNFNFK